MEYTKTNREKKRAVYILYTYAINGHQHTSYMDCVNQPCVPVCVCVCTSMISTDNAQQ